MIKYTLLTTLLFLIALQQYIISGLYKIMDTHVTIEKYVYIKTKPFGILKIKDVLNPQQNDFILDHNKWYCTKHDTEFRWSKVELDNSNGYRFYLGNVKGCSKYERLGST